MNIYEKQYFLNYPANDGEPYFVFYGQKPTKSKILKHMMNLGYSKIFSELLIETGYAFAALYDKHVLHLHVHKRWDRERKNNWHLGRADQNPFEIGVTGMTGYWETVECLYENGLTWENAREAVAQGRYEEIMREKGRNIDEGPCDLSGWDSLDDHEISEELYWQILHTDDKFPHTREQTIGVIKILISFGYSSVMAQIYTAEGIAKRLVARGNLVYSPIKAILRDKKPEVWHGLDKPIAAPYLVSPEGERCSYFEFLWHCAENGDSIKEAMYLAENLRLPETLK